MRNCIKKSFMGGSFDHLHIGHHKLIKTAFTYSAFVTIGLTSDKMIKNKKFSKSLENYETRFKSLTNYLNISGYQDRHKIIKLTDIYGTTLEDKNSEAIFTTNDTKKKAELINRKRNDLGLEALEIRNIDLVKGDDGLVVSSERIRNGEINFNGESYTVWFNTFGRDLVLPLSLRDEFKYPFGNTFRDYKSAKEYIGNADIIVTVGDIVSADFVQNNNQASISVIDLKTRRENIYKSFMKKYFSNLPTSHLLNHAGTINFQTALHIKTYIQEFLQNKEKSVIVIEGEEDLLVSPFILFLPLGSLVIYGIYNQGLVVVKVTVEKKEMVKMLLSKFSIKD